MSKLVLILFTLSSPLFAATKPCSRMIEGSKPTFSVWLREKMTEKGIDGFLGVATRLNLSKTAIINHSRQNPPSDFVLSRYASLFEMDLASVKAELNAPAPTTAPRPSNENSWLHTWVAMKMTEHKIPTQDDLAARMRLSGIGQHFRRGEPSPYVLKKYAEFFKVELKDIYAFRDRAERNGP